MSKVTITGSAIVVTSALKLEDLKKLMKYRPNALTLMDESKNPVFAISVTHGNGRIDEYGASFSDTVTDAEGFATITMLHNGKADDVKATVADLMGPGVLQLNRLETSLTEVIEDVNAEREVMLNCIEIA